ncbi:hypothetical protein [Nannocystis exedens]|uniref:hypothetical protein n=1 Tax=Nannocystis exedens TaxID=54 RepID=UPI001160C206|nr:hypothetical protein [Nannocystis exedens]
MDVEVVASPPIVGADPPRLLVSGDGLGAVERGVEGDGAGAGAGGGAAVVLATVVRRAEIDLDGAAGDGDEGAHAVKSVVSPAGSFFSGAGLALGDASRARLAHLGVGGARGPRSPAVGEGHASRWFADATAATP